MIRIYGVQGRPPPSMLLWHINCIEQKSPKKQPIQGHSGHPLFPWKQEINLPCEMYPPCTRREKASLSLEVENLGWEAYINKLCYSFTSFYPKPQTCKFKFIVSLYKNCLFWSLLWVSYFYEIPYFCKIKICVFFSLCQFNYSVSQRTKRRERVFPPPPLYRINKHLSLCVHLILLILFWLVYPLLRFFFSLMILENLIYKWIIQVNLM